MMVKLSEIFLHNQNCEMIVRRLTGEKDFFLAVLTDFRPIYTQF